jgi:outer membrane receptor protein involved in Fe transport
MKFNYRFFFYLACALLFVVNSIYGGTTGKITGRVIDSETGKPLPSAIVIVEGTKLGASTDEDGNFMIINIPPNNYTLTIRYVGYAGTKIKDVSVSMDKTTHLQDIKVSSNAISLNEVVVSVKREAIQKDRTYSESSIDTKTIENLPVTSLQEVIQLQPGVVTQGGELHFRGGRGREVAYMVDGVPVNNDYSQSGGNNVAIENSMVQEVEVISGTFNAEYGSAQSGIVNIVTKGPSNNYHATLNAYTGGYYSNKTDVFIGINKVRPFSERDVQFSMTGPIITDKLSFFTSGRYNYSESYYNYEKRFSTLDGWKIAAYQQWFQGHNPDETSQSSAIYVPDSLRTGDLSVGPLSKSHSFNFNAKLDYAPMSAVRILYQMFGSVGYSLGSSSASRYQPDDGTTSTSFSHEHFLTFKHSPSTNFFYSLTFSYQYNTSDSYYRKDNKIAEYPGDSGIQLISTSADGFSLGSTGGFYTGKDGKNYRKQYLATGEFNWQADKINFFKAGFEFKRHDINTYSWGYIETKDWETKMWPSKELIDPKSMNFSQYWAAVSDYWKNWNTLFDTTKYRRYTEDEYTLWRDYTIKPMQFASYLQDKIELGEIIINGGVRFDLFDPNEKCPINDKVESYMLGSSQNMKNATVKYQFSPRLGISFPISAHGAFHAAYGHFFQMPSFQYMYNQPLYTLTALQLEGRVLGNANLEPEKTVSYEIGLQQELTESIGVDVTAYYKDFRNLLGLEKITTVDAVGYEKYTNRDYGNSKGITVGIHKGGNDFVTGSINYTLSFSNGSSSDPNLIQLIQSASSMGGETETFVDRQILPLDWDQRHTLNVIVSFQQPGDWSLSILSSLSSGNPYSPTFIDKSYLPAIEYKNSSFKPSSWDVSLKAKKNFSFGGINYMVFLKIDNLFDHLNQSTVYSSSGTADYNARLLANKALVVAQLEQEGVFNLHEIDNHPEYYSSPRKIQVGVEVNF